MTQTTSSKKTKVEISPEDIITHIPVEKIYMGANLARDTHAGVKGHSDADIDQIMHDILEVGFLINAILVGPMGYRDENHPDTPADCYPVLGGFGRKQAYDRLRKLYPTDTRWFAIPSKIVPLGEGEDAVLKAEKINWFENVRIQQTSIALGHVWDKMSSRGIKRAQIANVFNLAPATIDNGIFLTYLPKHMQELLVQAEKNLPPFHEKKYERNGVTMNKPRASFYSSMFRELNTAYTKANKIPATLDFTNLANAVYAHWEKSGVWDEAVAKNFVDGVRARLGQPPKDGVAKASPVEPNTPEPKEAPKANGGVSDQHRANKDGDPKPVTTSQNPASNAPTTPPASTPASPSSYKIMGAGETFANMLIGTNIPELVKIGQFAVGADWEMMVGGKIRPTELTRSKFESLITEVFGTTKATASAS